MGARRCRLRSASWLPFPCVVIAVAVRWYLRHGLSYRDVEELLAEHGVDVDRRGRRRGTVHTLTSHSPPLSSLAIFTADRTRPAGWQVEIAAEYGGC